MELYIPDTIIQMKVGHNLVRHLLDVGYHSDFEVEEYRQGYSRGFLLSNENEKIALLIKGTSVGEEINKVIKVRKYNGQSIQNLLKQVGRISTKLEWINHPAFSSDLNNYFTIGRVETVKKSWRNAFFFKEETPEENGLRKPQIGAIHATLAHWTTTKDPATVVMPTGTGKTETMLSLLIAKQCNRLLIVVPHDALREQIANKLVSLGILKEFGIVSENAQFPIVGTLYHKPKTIEEVDNLFSKCNVLVSTMSIVAGCSEGIQTKIAYHCSHLFIDEAHHVAATTWEKFKESFNRKQIIQFTATPFRNDKKPISGSIIYNYPLQEAQRDGYFKNIIFEPIVEFNPDRADYLLAEKAVRQLRKDLEKKYDHILMARVEKIERANEIFSYYANHPDLKPVVVHSKLQNSRQILEAIKRREHRIIICVNMLGEGFDLPQLKVAAIHDNHKSLGVTLQFAGRFTRNMMNPDSIGDAHFFANIADPGVEESLEELYGEDSNWNIILRVRSNEEIAKPLKLTELVQGFTNTGEVSLQNLQPKFSAVVYKLPEGKSWNPGMYKLYFKEEDVVYADVNNTDNVLIVITKNERPIDWGKIKDLCPIGFDLFLVYWNRGKNLLFINSSNKGSLFGDLAEYIGGEDAELIKGDDVFRCFHGVRRITLHNVGLLYALNGPMRYVMYTGIDVTQGLTPGQLSTKVKSNVFGVGYTQGEKLSIGCSYKGRIWSRSNGTLSEFKEWCDKRAEKLVDCDIDGDEVLKGVLIPEVIKKRPKLHPVTIEWADSILQNSESRIELFFDQIGVPLYDIGLKLLVISDTGPFVFTIESHRQKSIFQLEINETGKGFRYTQIRGLPMFIRIGSSTKPILEWFESNPPRIWFEDTSFIENNIHISPVDGIPIVFNLDQIISWNWDGTNIRSESQGFDAVDIESIQYRVVQEIRKINDYKIIFNDDDSYEAADLIALFLEGNKVVVELYHCKFSGQPIPGSRVGDLYEVCGQAQRSVHWRQSIRKLIEHMKLREKRKVSQGNTRFVVGGSSDLVEIEKMVRFKEYEYRIFIVQPGVKKADISEEQLKLLAATEFYLQETYQLPLIVISS